MQISAVRQNITAAISQSGFRRYMSISAFVSVSLATPKMKRLLGSPSSRVLVSLSVRLSGEQRCVWSQEELKDAAFPRVDLGYGCVTEMSHSL